MEQSWKTLFLLTFFCTFGLITSAKAQITPDNSLGAESSSIGPDNIQGISFDRIRGGATRGANLFHSFQEFNVGNGQLVYFSNPAGIGNILTRVTGVNRSNILGRLGVLGNANLFLINPNGIFFGRNASLDVRGSFFGSSANSLIFDNGFEFSATNAIAPPLLTVNIPIGLRFRDNPGNITNASSRFGLEVLSGQTLALVGGDVSLDGGVLIALGGKVELGGLKAGGTVGINNDGSLSFPESVQRGDVLLTNGSFVDLRGGGGGTIAVNARNLELSGESILATGIRQGFGSVGSQAGNIEIDATGTVKISGGSFIFNSVPSRTTGNSGDINIKAESVFLDNAQLIASNAGRGNGGDIGINVGSLSVTNSSVIRSSTSGEGNAGNLFIKARDLVEVLGTGEPGGTSSLRANVEGGATGNGGDLTIDTKKLVVRNAQVSASVFGRGNAGNLTVIATDSVELSGKVFSRGESGQIIRNPAGLFAQVNTDAEGKGGNLTIHTPRLSVGDGARVQVATFGQGDAGNLLIRASDIIDVYETEEADFFPGGIFAGVQVDEDETVVPPRGGGGTLTIETDRLRVRDGGRVSATTEGQGNAGTLQIRANDSVEVFGLSPNGKFISEISAGATSESTGTGGSLLINTGKLIVRDRGTVTVRSENTKPAGNLEITARTINLDNQGSLTATTNSGDGGNITLNVRDYLFMRRNSEISTSAGGNGGNIIIDAPFIVAFPSNNDITANAGSGSGGQVRINATLFGIAPLSAADLRRLRPNDLDPRQLPTSDITAISRDNPSLSLPVQVTSPDVDPSRGLVELPETVSDRTQQIAQSPCQQGVGNEFVVTGRGGFPTNPNQTLSSDNVRVDLLQPVASTVYSRSATIKPATNPTATRIPAQGWIFNDKGQVVLTAYDPTNTGSQRSWRTAACPAR